MRCLEQFLLHYGLTLHKYASKWKNILPKTSFPKPESESPRLNTECRQVNIESRQPNLAAVIHCLSSEIPWSLMHNSQFMIKEKSRHITLCNFDGVHWMSLKTTDLHIGKTVHCLLEFFVSQFLLSKD